MFMNFYVDYMINFKNSFYTFFLFFLLLSCDNTVSVRRTIVSNNVHEKVKLNYLVYLAADNELEQFAIQNIQEMKNVGSNENLNILVLFDRSPGFDSSHGNWTSTKLFLITRGKNDFMEDEIFDFGELDMKSKGTLDFFLTFIQNYFPADKTILTLWSHGFGIYPEANLIYKNNFHRSLISDYTTDYAINNSLAIQDLSEILKKHSINVLHFDACNMAMLEIAWELSEYIDYIVFSQLQIPSKGMDYESLLSSISDFKNESLEELVISYPNFFYNKYKETEYQFSLSAISMKRFKEFKKQFIFLCDFLYELSEEQLMQLFDIRKKMLPFLINYEEYIDFISFLDICLKQDLFSDDLLLYFAQTRRCILDSIVSESHSFNIENIYGILFNYPTTIDQITNYNCSNYPLLKIYTETKLNDFILRCFPNNF